MYVYIFILTSFFFIYLDFAKFDYFDDISKHKHSQFESRNTAAT